MVKFKKEHTEHNSKNAHSDEHPKEKVVAEDQNKEIEDLKKKVEEKEKEAAAHYDKYVRSVAEFDNYKKRALKDKADAIKYGNENIIKDILPFMDSLDRALEHDTGDVQAFKDGVALIQDQLLCCLKKYGVEKIEAAMANQFGDSLSNMEVPPGKAIPFVVVITNLPADARDYGVELVGSTVSTGKK